MFDKTLSPDILLIKSTNLHAALTTIRDSPKWNKDRPRIVVMTKVPERTTVATGRNRFFAFIIHS